MRLIHRFRNLLVRASLAVSTGLGFGPLAAPLSAQDMLRGEVKFHVPEVDEIRSMTASVYDHFLGAMLGPDFESFEIPRQCYPDILAHFEDCHLDNNPRKSWRDEMGTIRINLKSGQCERICWVWIGHKAHLHFVCAGRRYTHEDGQSFAADETLTLDARIRELYRIEKDGRRGLWRKGGHFALREVWPDVPDPQCGDMPYRGASTPGKCELPDIRHVSSIVAEAYCHPAGKQDLPPFDVPIGQFADVLKRFEESDLEPPRPDLDVSEVASLRCHMRAGGNVRICVYADRSQYGLRFSIDGIRYMHVGKKFGDDEALAFYAYLAELAQAARREAVADQ